MKRLRSYKTFTLQRLCCCVLNRKEILAEGWLRPKRRILPSKKWAELRKCCSFFRSVIVIIINTPSSLYFSLYLSSEGKEEKMDEKMDSRHFARVHDDEALVLFFSLRKKI